MTVSEFQPPVDLDVPMVNCVYRAPPTAPMSPVATHAQVHTLPPPEQRKGSDDDAESESSKEEGTPVEPGMLLESKDLYRSDPRAEWGVWAPDDIGIDAKETEASAKFALIVKRDKIQEEDGSSALKLHSIQVQSPLIKELLGPVFQDYPGIKTSLKKLRFSAPFREFFYRWSEFVLASKQSDKDDHLKGAHFKLLFDVISAEIKPHIEEVTDLIKNEVINFPYLWAIFEPEMDVYSLVDGQHRLYRMKSAKYVELPGGGNLFQLSCQFVDTDGTNFGDNYGVRPHSACTARKEIRELERLSLQGICWRVHAYQRSLGPLQ